MAQNGNSNGGAPAPAGAQPKAQPSDGVVRLGPSPPQDDAADVSLDERLDSAATPFLYLMAAVVVAVLVYFIYRRLRG